MMMIMILKWHHHHHWVSDWEMGFWFQLCLQGTLLPMTLTVHSKCVLASDSEVPHVDPVRLQSVFGPFFKEISLRTDVYWPCCRYPGQGFKGLSTSGGNATRSAFRVGRWDPLKPRAGFLPHSPKQPDANTDCRTQAYESMWKIILQAYWVIVVVAFCHTIVSYSVSDVPSNPTKF